ncbi:hypothetical protein LINPERHAP1_LOCUS13604 [Linum perenne]
MHGLLGLLEPS